MDRFEFYNEMTLSTYRRKKSSREIFQDAVDLALIGKLERSYELLEKAAILGVHDSKPLSMKEISYVVDCAMNSIAGRWKKTRYLINTLPFILQDFLYR